MTLALIAIVICVYLIYRWLREDKRQFEPDEHKRESIG